MFFSPGYWLFRSRFRAIISVLVIFQCICALLYLFVTNVNLESGSNGVGRLQFVQTSIPPVDWKPEFSDGVREKLLLPCMQSTNASLVEQTESDFGIAPNKTALTEYMKHVLSWCEEEEEEDKRLRRDLSITSCLCPCIPGGLRGRHEPDLTKVGSLTWKTAASIVNNTQPGGHWRPDWCTPRRRVAVIVPCRDREAHLRAFLVHTHPILQRQLIEYKIFVVEQDMPYTFNKGSMMNIGFRAASTNFHPHCVLFHDVDMLMENDRHIVVCGKRVQQMGAFTNIVNYRPRYPMLLGGAVLARSHDFANVNGFSNSFFGWGGEDDDFSNRVRWRKLGIYRAPVQIACYTMIKHQHDKGNPKSKVGYLGRRYRPELYSSDGVNNVQYIIHHRIEYPLYTWIHATLNETNGNAAQFQSRANFTMSNIMCLIEDTSPRHFLSRVSCRNLCIRDGDKCVTVKYTAGEGHDPYCQLSSTVCTDTEPSENHELHVKYL